MRSHPSRDQFRQTYKPTADRVPRWARRLWLWF